MHLNARRRHYLFIGLGSALSASALSPVPAMADDGNPALMSGTVHGTHGRPVPGASVIARVENDVPGRTTETVVARAITDAAGGFQLKGPLTVPATRSRDGAVRIEVTATSPEMVRYYVFSVMPPTAADPVWTWSKVGSNPALVAGSARQASLIGRPVRQVVLSLTANGKAARTSGPAGRLVATPTDSMLSPHAPDDGGVAASPSEAADVAADTRAIADGTMAAIEAQQASEQCTSGGEIYWKDTSDRTDRDHVIAFDRIANKTKGALSFQNSNKSSFSVVYAGAGANYAGGLWGTQKDDAVGAGIDAVKGAGSTNDVHNWKIEIRYKKQERWCYNAGYPYFMGRTRWVPLFWTGGNRADTDATTFACDASNRIRTESDFWVTKETTATWKGWVSIAGVQATSEQTRSTSHKSSYLLKNPDGFARLCGNNNVPTMANFAEEVPS